MVVKKFHNRDIRYSDSSLTLNKSLHLSVSLDFGWWKFFKTAFQCVYVQVVVVLYVPICPEGYSQKNWMGVCSLLPETLTLFMTKICHIPYPIYDLTKNTKPNL